MKILQLSSIELDLKANEISTMTILKVIALMASLVIIGILLFNSQYIWALGFTILSMATIFCYRLYQEVSQIDFNIEGIEISLEEIVEELG